jgi:hypothetical protein
MCENSDWMFWGSANICWSFPDTLSCPGNRVHVTGTDVCSLVDLWVTVRSETEKKAKCLSRQVYQVLRIYKMLIWIMLHVFQTCHGKSRSAYKCCKRVTMRRRTTLLLCTIPISLTAFLSDSPPYSAGESKDVSTLESRVRFLQFRLSCSYDFSWRAPDRCDFSPPPKGRNHRLTLSC